MEPFNNIENSLVRIENKIDSLNGKMVSLDKTQIEIEKDLEYHIARTDVLQEEVSLNKRTAEMMFDKFTKKLEPFESIRFTWQNILKLVTLVGTLSGIVVAIIKIVEHI